LGPVPDPEGSPGDRTVLLYDVMLAGQGAGALDWIGRDLQEIGTSLELGEWYVGAMGLRVSVWDVDGWRDVAWVRDVGPIAWEDVGIMVPVLSDTVRVRLSFVADAWRIDRIAVAATAHRPATRQIPLARIRDAGGENGRALAAARAPDEAYLTTTPGQWFSAEFDVGPASVPRTMLLVSQGYYVEWMRPDWIRNAGRTAPFVPSNERLIEAIDRWRAVQDAYERRFFESRFPVR